MDDQLPIEITTDILSMLPVKYVFRCRCVCKTWKIIIDNRRLFAPLHFTRSLVDHHNKSSLIFVPIGIGDPIYYMVEVKQQQEQQYILKTSKIDYDGPELYTKYASYRSYHGFLSFSYASRTCYNTYIHNPATREFIKLPTVVLQQGPAREHRNYIGIGYDHSSNVFKVVQIMGIRFSFVPVKVQVCTLGSNSWRELENFPRVPCLPSKPALINGSLHWTSIEHILSFNLASEYFGLVEYPRINLVQMSNHHKFELVVLDGCLSIVDHSWSWNEALELWIMTDYNVKESWMKLVIKRRYVEDGVLFYNVRPVFLWKNGELLLLYGSNVLVFYEIESGRYTPFEIEGLPPIKFDVYPYVGNLMAIDTTCRPEGQP